MPLFYILGALAVLLLLILLPSFICFYLVFYSKSRRELRQNEYEIPPGRIYEPYRERMIEWIKQMRTLPHENVSIVSHDGLTLRGRYYEYQKGAIVELLFHGYRGNSERDLCGAVDRCFSLGRNALIIDQRASGRSDGHVISFGINEHKDCLRWIDYAIERFGPDVKLIITGISMGATTVMMAAGENLPPNVVSVLADCGYTTPKEIICEVMRQMHLPARLLYPFIRLGGWLFGHFDLEETSATEAMARCKIPVIFYHGDTDDFVPCDMSRQLYEICNTTKRLVLVPGAGHGLAFPMDEEGYLRELREFEAEYEG